MPDAITYAVPEGRDPLLAILVLDRVATRCHGLFKEIDQHAASPTRPHHARTARASTDRRMDQGFRSATRRRRR